MSDLGSLLRMLASPKPSVRFEATELLRVSPAITNEALAALERALRDPDPEVAQSARSALLVHAPHAPNPPAPMDRRQRALAVHPHLQPWHGMYLVFAMLFAATWYFLRPIRSELDASGSWPTTSGTVLSSEVVERSSSEGPWFSPEVEFEYQVGGARYTAVDAPTFGRHGDIESRSDSQKTVDQYPPGRIVTVYYYPRWPRVAVLIRGSGLPATPIGFLLSSAIYCVPPIGFAAFLGLWLWRAFPLIRKRIST